MADKIKEINRALPAVQRYVKFTNTELATGDIIRVYESLGRPADTLTIEVAVASDLTIKVNPKIKVAKRRAYPEEEAFGWAQYGYENLAKAVEFDTGVDSLPVGGSAALNYQLNDLPINNLQVTFTTGTFTIILS